MFTQAMDDVTSHGISGLTKLDIERLHEAECMIKYCIIPYQFPRYDYQYTKTLIKKGKIKFVNVWTSSAADDNSYHAYAPDSEPQIVSDEDTDDSDAEAENFDEIIEYSDEDGEQLVACVDNMNPESVRLTRNNFRSNSLLPQLVDYASLIYECLPLQLTPVASDERKMELFLKLLGKYKVTNCPTVNVAGAVSLDCWAPYGQPAYSPYGV